ncbi:MAG TPA: TraR/DksA family transcriptional regulator [Candidatus Paceibacterota bacterium]
MKISDKDLSLYKEQLEREAGDIEAQLKNEKKTKNFGDDVESDFSEEADEAEETATNLSVQEVLKERLEAIEHALDKITKGTYGVCEECSDIIDARVLKINPESRLCQACKQKQK